MPLRARLALVALVAVGLVALVALASTPVQAEGMSLLGLGDAGQPATGPMAGGSGAGAGPAQAFVTGFNQAWLRNAYGSQWGQGFDEAEARRLLGATREFGGRVLRMWLFEGVSPGGVEWDGVPGRGVATDRAATLATGYDPRNLANLERFLVMASEEGVLVYLTLFDGNLGSWARERQRDTWWNVLNELYGAGEAFRRNVLGPVLDVVARHRGAVFALDLCNEGNALVKYDLFADGWTSCQGFVRRWREFVRARVDLPVGLSFGHGSAVSDLLSYRYRLPPELVDFYDFHLYNNGGDIPHQARVAHMARTCGRPVYLGEFGQKSAAFDDALQAAVTTRFIEQARSAGLAGALPWRLSDVRPGVNAEARFSYEAFGRWRPAMEAFRRASAAR